MSDRSYPTGIGTSDTDSIQLLGLDLAEDVLGKVSFGELAYWLATKRRPTAGQLRVFEAALVSLADHGYTPTAIAARMTYYSAPESIQGAIASGLLGGGSRFLGVTEDTGQFLAKHIADLGDTSGFTADQWDAIARDVVVNAKRCQDQDSRSRSPGAQAGRPPHARDVQDRSRSRGLRAAPVAVRSHRASALRGARPYAAPQRSRRRRGIAG